MNKRSKETCLLLYPGALDEFKEFKTSEEDYFALLEALYEYSQGHLDFISSNESVKSFMESHRRGNKIIRNIKNDSDGKDEWLTTRKIAKVLYPFMSFALISKLCNQGKMPFEVQRIRGRWYAKRETVEEYLKKITT